MKSYTKPSGYFAKHMPGVFPLHNAGNFFSASCCFWIILSGSRAPAANNPVPKNDFPSSSTTRALYDNHLFAFEKHDRNEIKRKKSIIAVQNESTKICHDLDLMCTKERPRPSPKKSRRYSRRHTTSYAPYRHLAPPIRFRENNLRTKLGQWEL